MSDYLQRIPAHRGARAVLLEDKAAIDEIPLIMVELSSRQ